MAEAPGTRLGRSGAWKNVLDESPLFEPTEDASFPFEHRLTRDQLVDQLASRSWLAALPPEAFERALADIRRVLEARGVDSVELPYRTEVYCSTAACVAVIVAGR